MTQQLYRAVEMVEVQPFHVVNIKSKIYVHLIPTHNAFMPQQLLSLQTVYQQRGITLVHLWEDVWLKSRTQVLSRIQSFCGLNRGLHARKAKILQLEKQEAQHFLNENHLQGYINTKYNYGLAIDGKLVAVGCFSNTRPMKSRGENYLSAELIRFATLTGYTVVGGLSKLTKHFLKQVPTNDLMTYADRDWSLGKGYEQLHFQQSGISSPVFFYLDTATLIRYQVHRLPKKIQLAYSQQQVLNLDDFLSENGFVKVFNTGNLKYHLFI